MVALSTLQELALQSVPWSFESRDQLPSAVPVFRKPPYFGLAGEVIEKLLAAFLQNSERTEAQYIREVQNIAQESATQIRERRNYQFFPDFLNAIEARFGLSWPELLPTFFERMPSFPALLCKTALIIWALLEKDGRWPVVVRRNQLARKLIELPADPGEALQHLLFVGAQLLPAFQFLDQEDLNLVPEQFVGHAPQDSANRIVVPTPITPVEQTLENAYYNQRYFLHPLGAAVKLRHGGDLAGAFLKVKHGVVIGRFHTANGDILCLLDLNTAKGVNVAQVLQGGPPDFLVRILANVYHALVVAKEKPSPHRKRAEEIPLATRYPLAETEKFLSISYIPRTVYVGGKEQTLSPREQGIFRRPRQPSPVRPHASWRGSISEHQRQRVQEFEQATGLSILDKLPPGQTFVLPHFNPALEPGEKVELPLFIKKQVEAELVGTDPRAA